MDFGPDCGLSSEFILLLSSLSPLLPSVSSEAKLESKVSPVEYSLDLKMLVIRSLSGSGFLEPSKS